ncbi:MAG: phosphatidylserine decarboxylase [Candidatus Rokubacteria bacterium]|nr:phosphatidylserine decarboxylase [Candidatus Rokubacteria bacterium]
MGEHGGRGALRIPVAAEGWPLILTFAAAAGALWAFGWSLGALAFAALAVGCLFFFRDPERVAPTLAGAIVAPADGRVVAVRGVVDPFVGEGVRVSIFLSPLDVHVNRAPLAGLVTDVEYRRGRFRAAYRDEASDVNERCTLRLQGEAVRVTVTQIAGVLARRIVCRARSGDKLGLGERFGLICFGSRTDLVVPRETDLRVRQGEHVRGGESLIGVIV